MILLDTFNNLDSNTSPARLLPCYNLDYGKVYSNFSIVTPAEKQVAVQVNFAAMPGLSLHHAALPPPEILNSAPTANSGSVLAALRVSSPFLV